MWLKDRAALVVGAPHFITHSAKVGSHRNCGREDKVANHEHCDLGLLHYPTSTSDIKFELLYG